MRTTLAAALVLALSAGYVYTVIREPMPEPPIAAFGPTPGSVVKESFTLWRQEYYAPVAPEWLEFLGFQWIKSPNGDGLMSAETEQLVFTYNRVEP